MASPTRHAAKTAFFPPGVTDFFRRRTIELVGIALAMLGAAVIVALAGYHANDPSLNTAVPGGAQNLLGVPGAWMADFMMQTMGLAAWLIGAMIMVWGWRIGTHRGMGRLWLRFTALPVSVLLSTIALAGIQPGADWPLRSGLGGFAGDMQMAALIEAASPLLPLGPGWFAVAASVMAVIAFGTALGLDREEWRSIVWGLFWLGASGARAGARVGSESGRLGLKLSRWSFHTAVNGTRVLAERRRQAKALEASAEFDAGAGTLPGERREPQLARPFGTPEIESARPGTDNIVAPRRARPAPGKRAQSERQAKLDLIPDDEYHSPDLNLLDVIGAGRDSKAPDQDALAENARFLESVLEDFGVQGKVVKVRPGPVVTLYELEPAPGTKSSRVIGLADDIARSLSAISVRVAVVPGRNVIGIELPNASRETVSLRELLASKDIERSSAALALVLGKDIGGKPVIADLGRMPHLLIAGTTGSGKSVAINTMILSLLYRLPPEECRLVMIDPKMLELSVYDGIPHLLTPVVTDPSKAVMVLRWTVREMERRYRAMSNLNVRNISGYNARLAQARRKGEKLSRTVQTGFDPESGEPIYEEQPMDMDALPHIVVVVDEMADLMLVAGKEVEASVQRLAQMARAAGMHLIMATQRPSVDVITGTIKANFPTRISFQVTSKIDSRTILGDSGAEQLLGQGDMLYLATGGRVIRVHGPLVTDEEVERVVSALRKQGRPVYLEEVIEDGQGPPIPGMPGSGSGDDELYDQAVAIVCAERKASTSFVQRHLQIGYNRAARIIERMEKEGVISPANHVGKREVLARNIEDRMG